MDWCRNCARRSAFRSERVSARGGMKSRKARLGVSLRLSGPSNFTDKGFIPMLSYATYLDASRDPSGIVVVGGYFAPVYCWEKFEIDWRLVLAQFDVPYFHMKEFIYSVGHFSQA